MCANIFLWSVGDEEKFYNIDTLAVLQAPGQQVASVAGAVGSKADAALGPNLEEAERTLVCSGAVRSHSTAALLTDLRAPSARRNPRTDAGLPWLDSDVHALCMETVEGLAEPVAAYTAKKTIWLLNRNQNLETLAAFLVTVSIRSYTDCFTNYSYKCNQVRQTEPALLKQPSIISRSLFVVQISQQT